MNLPVLLPGVSLRSRVLAAVRCLIVRGQAVDRFSVAREVGCFPSHAYRVRSKLIDAGSIDAAMWPAQRPRQSIRSRVLVAARSLIEAGEPVTHRRVGAMIGLSIAKVTASRSALILAGKFSASDWPSSQGRYSCDAETYDALTRADHERVEADYAANPPIDVYAVPKPPKVDLIALSHEVLDLIPDAIDAGGPSILIYLAARVDAVACQILRARERLVTDGLLYDHDWPLYDDAAFLEDSDAAEYMPRPAGGRVRVGRLQPEGPFLPGAVVR